MLTNEMFLQRLKDNNIVHIPLEEYKGIHNRIRFRCGINPNHIFETTPATIYHSNKSCPYCNYRKVFIGETDMWTTNPQLAQMLLNKDDGYKYFEGSGKKVDWVCSNCGTIVKNKIIKNVKMQGLSCPNCKDGMSFGEKFVYSLLEQLDVYFTYDKTTSWSNGKRYDFYLPNNSMIIEVNGIQHYERGFVFKKARNNKVIVDERANDKYKKEKALSNGIINYVELDCRYSTKEYIMQSIQNSILSTVFNLSCIDWNKCFCSTFTSNVIRCAELWNSGIKSTKKISELTGIHICSVISNLKKAKQINLCDYETAYRKYGNKANNIRNVINLYSNTTKSIKEIASLLNISKSYVSQLLIYANSIGICDYTKKHNGKNIQKRKIICVETKKMYNSISSVKEDGYKRNCVSNCLCGLSKTAHGKHWIYIDEK